MNYTIFYLLDSFVNLVPHCEVKVYFLIHYFIGHCHSLFDNIVVGIGIWREVNSSML